MAYDQIVMLKGATKKYRLNPAVKRYTLRDHGFQETKSGNFQFTRSLNTEMGNKAGALLKIVVAKDFSGFKMSTTSANGLKAIDIYGNPNMMQFVENLEYIMDYFVKEQIFDEV